MKKILVVGAGGFIGGFICSEALRRGYATWAGVRPSTSRRYLDLPGINIVDLDYGDARELARQLQQAAPEGGWDEIIYNLGATKALNFGDFNKINFEYLRTFAETLAHTGLMPRKFLFMSSLSALGLADEKNYTPIDSSTIPHPNTRYGLSK